MQPTIGRSVHVCIALDQEGAPVYRPATVVAVWGETCVNVQVQLDGSNDYPAGRYGDHMVFTPAELERGLAWRTSLVEGEGVGSWRWPPRA